jgi:hypothetical protein
MKEDVVYFEHQSYKDEKITITVLHLALERAKKLGIKRVVVPSCSGETALRAVEIFKGSGIELIVVSDRAGVKFSRKEYRDYANVRAHLLADEVEEFLNTLGFEDKEEIKSGLSWKPELVMKLREQGINVAVASEPFRTILHSRVNPDFVIAETLALFGRGLKVAVEVVLEACDAGFVNVGEEVISLGGLSKGVDTALVLRACHRDELFSGSGNGLQIREIICKPRLK